ncbi:SDR family NAD(P)-dependent oxidoreductase [Ideonella paludis]|uniref:SDR family NAD(P)-dependent oxidoreductase n=1 Tax=Ideonella paludis TaxID=1233411 RepID=A0ABS5DVX8_9BURK|nr:SDR family NAD(P)-dependent oxidoreductase [Ideonella paludis]MBQ0935304.1 SDR family NAD(P)-dependent oxidoreductase [Ideonella paludis]
MHNAPVTLITGASSGIGRVTALALARAGHRMVLAGRGERKHQPVLEEIAALPGAPEARWLPLDLGDLASVAACVKVFEALGWPLHTLILNAGLAGQRGRSASGFEMAFGVNHLGHFALTQALLPCLQASAPARVITVASKMHFRAKGLDWDALQRPTASLTGVPEYNASKLANVLFATELARRLAGTGVESYVVHPGIVATEVWRHVPALARPLLKLMLNMITPEEGARSTLKCALSPSAELQAGGYYDRARLRSISPVAQDLALAQDLWQHSERWVAKATGQPH